jgi:cytosine/adenosine deaminase-related metal-dependent hydrolase
VSSSVLIDRASCVITMDPGRRVLADASVLVRDGLIERVGWPEDSPGDPWRADEVVDGRAFVVTPGLVNAHFHVSAPFTACRNLHTDLEGSLADYFRLLRAMPDADSEAAFVMAITELLLGGTTTFGDPGDTEATDSLVAAVDRTGVRATLGRYVADVENPDVRAQDTAACVRAQEAFIERYGGGPGSRIRAWICLLGQRQHATDGLLRELGTLAARVDVPATVHAASSPTETQRTIDAFGVSPVERLARTGFLGSHAVLAHAIGVSDRDIEMLAEAGAGVTLSAMTVLRAAMGAGPHGKHPEMLAAGVPVALGADGGDWGPVSVHRAMYVAAGLFKDARMDATLIPPETALEMGTLHGARVLGLEGVVGAVAPGMRADLVLWDTRRPEWHALIDPVATLVFSADAGSVDTVLVDGRVVVRHHEPVYGDLEAIIAAGDAAGRRAMEATGIAYPRAWPLQRSSDDMVDGRDVRR